MRTRARRLNFLPSASVGCLAIFIGCLLEAREAKQKVAKRKRIFDTNGMAQTAKLQVLRADVDGKAYPVEKGVHSRIARPDRIFQLDSEMPGDRACSRELVDAAGGKKTARPR